MGIYTTRDQVISMFRDLTVSASGTVITNDKLDEFIEEAEEEIQAKLDPYYELPITLVSNPKSFKILRRIARYKVAHIIKTILEAGTQVSDKNQDVQTNLEKKADALLADLLPQFNKLGVSAGGGRWEEPIMPLPDATRKAFPPKTAAHFSSNETDEVILAKRTDTHRRVIRKGGSDGLGGDNW